MPSPSRGPIQRFTKSLRQHPMVRRIFALPPEIVMSPAPAEGVAFPHERRPCEPDRARDRESDRAPGGSSRAGSPVAARLAQSHGRPASSDGDRCPARTGAEHP